MASMKQFIGISEARAQEAMPPAPEAPGILESLFPIFLIFIVFYFLLIRPQQKKVKQHQQMVEALRRGDKVVTAGGIVGTVTKIEDDMAHVEIAPNVRIKVMKATIGDVLSRTGPADSSDSEPKEKEEESGGKKKKKSGTANDN